MENEKLAGAPQGTQVCGKCDGRGVIYQCAVCGTDEPRTGTCSDPHDPRSLCAALATQPAEQASAGSIGDDADFMFLLHEIAAAMNTEGRNEAKKNVCAYIDSRPRQADQLDPIGYISDGVIEHALAKGFGASTYIQAGQPTTDFPVAIYAATPQAPSDTQGAERDGVVEELTERLERAERRSEIFALERDHARAHYDRAFKVMMSVYGMLGPGEDMRLPDGRVVRFMDPNAAETLHYLSRAIKAIPEKLAELAASDTALAQQVPDAVRDGVGAVAPAVGDWGMSATITPEYKTEQAAKNVRARASLDALTGQSAPKLAEHNKGE